MGPDQIAPPIRAIRRARYLAPIVAIVLLGGTAFAACSSDDHQAGATAASWTFAPAGTNDGATGPAAPAGGSAESAMPGPGGMSADGSMTPAAIDAAWAHRPAFTHVSATTEAAYAYALHNPQLMQWFPCYCGCAAMGHRSNLDCYLKPTTDSTISFEEHASYCDICVQITLKAKELIAQGMSLRDARAAIDRQFAGSVPGTPTEVPPR